MSGRRDNWELERRLQTACLLVVATILTGAATYWLRAVLIPFVLALFLFQILDFGVRLLSKKARLPHWLAVSVMLTLAGTLIFLASSVITNSIGQILQSSDIYVQRLDDLLEGLARRFPVLEDRFRILSQGQIEEFSQRMGSFLGAITNSLIYLLSQSTVVVIFLMFLLFGADSDPKELPAVLRDIDHKIKNYILVKTLLSVVTGTFVGLFLYFLGIELALVFGMMAILLNYIPTVGSLIATMLPIPVVLVSPDVSSGEAVLAILVPGIIQFLIGNILEPKLVGNRLNLSPVMILLSLAIWSSLWGGVGALLAVPITAVIQILCEQLEFTKPISAILRGDFLALIESYKKTDELTLAQAPNKAIPEQLAQIDKSQLYKKGSDDQNLV